MGNQSKEKQLYQTLTSQIHGILDDENAKEIFNALKTGQNQYLRLDRIESSSFDNSWIENIESCLFDLGTIINNPRMVTKTTADLTPIELAKKTNSTSIMHLASHTQYIKDIDENGNVIPNKILSIGAEDDLKTYENRFIATLIRKLVLFVEKRYEFAKSFASLMDHEQLYFKNQSDLHGSKVRIETKIVVDSPKEEKVEIVTTDYLKRIEQVREYILYYYNSRFMKIFKTDKNVRNPILQTNIIRKNPKYHHCYELYRFIESYDKLGVNYSVEEEYQDFNSEEINSLNLLMLYNFLSLQGKDKESKTETKTNQYDPVILKSSDDEEFVYGPLLKGPISFVRTDKAYQTYLNSLTYDQLPPHPTNREKTYFRDEYRKKLMTKQEYQQKEFLLERKKNDAVVFDEVVKERIRKMEEELEFLKEKRMKKRHEEEEEYLRKFRSLLADDARKFQIDQHDFGTYLSNEVYTDLKNGIGLSHKIENAPKAVNETIEEVKDLTKEDSSKNGSDSLLLSKQNSLNPDEIQKIEGMLLEEETIQEKKEPVIQATLLSEETLLPVHKEEKIVPVSYQAETISEEKKEEIRPEYRIVSKTAETLPHQKDVLLLVKQESDSKKELDKAVEEERERLLLQYQALLEEERRKNEELRKNLGNGNQRTPRTDSAPSKASFSDRQLSDRKYILPEKRNPRLTGDYVKSGYLSDLMKKNETYQYSDLPKERKDTPQKGGYLSKIMKEDPIYRKSKEDEMDYPSYLKEKKQEKKKSVTKKAKKDREGFKEFGK